jgi:hypothetical protein
LKDIDVDAIVAEALNDPEVKQAMEEGMQKGVVTAEGIARNSAWTNPTPEQMETYSLVAQYALDQAADAVVEDEAAPRFPKRPRRRKHPRRPRAGPSGRLTSLSPPHKMRSGTAQRWRGFCNRLRTPMTGGAEPLRHGARCAAPPPRDAERRQSALTAPD